MVDSGDQVFDAPETTSANRLLGDEPEPTFDLIEPGRVGGSVVDLEARSLCQPESYLGMLVGGVVVYDQMNIKSLRHGLIDALEELKELLMPMTCLALGQDSAGGDVERGEQGGGACGVGLLAGERLDSACRAGERSPDRGSSRLRRGVAAPCCCRAGALRGCSRWVQRRAFT